MSSLPAASKAATHHQLALRATGIEVGFGGLLALRGVGVEVAPGEVVAIIGPNGAGKTTLLNAICGLVPARGTVEFAGRTLRRVDAERMARLGLARSFQHPPLVESASAVSNVMAGAHLRAGYGPLDQVFRPWKVARAESALADEARALLRLVHVDSEQMEREVSKLPHGARKRIDIARALMRQPSLLAMDEPTSGMGKVERAVVQRIVNAIRDERRIAVMVVEHHMDVVRAIADRVIVLEAGSVLVQGDVTEVLDAERFREATLVKGARDKAGPRAGEEVS